MGHKWNGAHRVYGARGKYGILALMLVLLAGCEIGSERLSPLEVKLRDLEQQKTQLAGQFEQAQVELEQARAQIKTLAALPPGRQEDFYALSAVTVGRFTGFYDKNGNGKRDKLVVYVQPIDRMGDVIKAPGVIGVQLWNLNDSNGQALLGQWQVRPEEVCRLWFNSLAMTAYRLTFDVPVSPAVLAQPLTVKITFAVDLTGQVFTVQHVIEPPTAP